MRPTGTLALLPAALLNVLALPVARAEHQLDIIEIHGDRVLEMEQHDEQGFAPTPGPTPDTAGLLKRMPGANVNRNGALTGIAQYRGLFGDRVNVQVDGMQLDASCPNAMDPPMSAIPHTQLDRLTLIRGIAPVSSGLESLGGTIRVESEGSEFGFSDRFETRADVEASAGSVNNRTGLGLGVSRANNTHRLHLRGSVEQGDDMDFANGTIRPTEFERRNFTVGYGFRRDGQEWGMDLRRNDTDDTGTPSLPMDIIYMDSTTASVNYAGTFGDTAVTAKVYGDKVDHRMDNYSLRTPVNPMMLRYSDVESRGTGFRFEGVFQAGAGDLHLGLDGHLVDHDAVIKDPNNAMFYVDNFKDVQHDTVGVYAEWLADFGNDWDVEAGARVNRASTDAGEVVHSMAMMNPNIASLRNDFNNADRSRTDTNVDWVLKLTHHLSEQLSLTAGAARKMRTPSYQERYLWVPLQATGGLADGNNYVGDINLKPETSHQLELGLDWNSPRAYVSPRVFYRKVDDYIQGTPATDPTVIMVSTMGGDPTPLQYSNVEATLYGADASWGLTLSDHWLVDGVISYVRGERDDIDDNLYRIAPPNMTVALTYKRDQWSATLEGVGYMRQDDVSATNGEQETGGYGLVNLSGEYRFGPRTRVLAGVENLFDRLYREHLNGYNRAVNPDIAIGERLPGAGRNVYVSLKHEW